MDSENGVGLTAPEAAGIESTKFRVLGVVSLTHFLNDSMQALLLPIYPLLKDAFGLSFAQLGMITLANQITASLLQPLVGYYTDRHPHPRSLVLGMTLTLAGLLVLSAAPAYVWLICGSALLGTGSSIFHPESSRVARSASGGRFGMAQSVFQVGGNAGQAFGPLLAMAVVMPNGQHSLSWFAVMPLLGIVLLLWVGKWRQTQEIHPGVRKGTSVAPLVPRRTLIRVFVVLLVLIFSKYFYIASINNYFIFYLEHRFGIATETAQLYLFAFMLALALGTLFGGPLGDRIGRKYVIWVSILGVAPFTLAMPYLNLAWTGIFVFIIGFVLSSAFSAIVVFAQELVPGHVGTVAGLFFGLSFGMGGIGAAVLGKAADLWGIDFVYHICAFLPLLGLFAVFIPNVKEGHLTKAH